MDATLDDLFRYLQECNIQEDRHTVLLGFVNANLKLFEEHMKSSGTPQELWLGTYVSVLIVELRRALDDMGLSPKQMSEFCMGYLMYPRPDEEASSPAPTADTN